jgi:carbamoyl-phosphate synthase small subunit
MSSARDEDGRFPAVLMLEDGAVFRGRALGRRAPAFGEVVFTTNMTGYQEVLTDPSYAGQIVTMTAPLIGNYGVTPEDEESGRPWVAGFVVRELSPIASNWRARDRLDAYLRAHGITALEGADTRALTRHIRSAGAMRGAIAPAEMDPDELLRQIHAQPPMTGLDLTRVVTPPASYTVPAEGEARYRVAVYDFGVKRRSLRLLARGGCELTVFPAATPASEILDGGFDGVFLSNGPGDPAAVPGIRETIKTLAEAGRPIFGICLGHQLLGLAFGAETYKLPYGHRGGNHPVRDLGTGRVEITSQNHGFAVRLDGDVIPGAPDLVPTHVNLNDGTLEGMRHRELPVFGVQYHPESAPGPHDSRYLFDRFLDALAGRRPA